MVVLYHAKYRSYPFSFFIKIVKTVKNLKDKGRTNVSMLLYGYGDGGGGPTYVYLLMYMVI